MIRVFWNFYVSIFPSKPTPPPIYKPSRFAHVLDSSRKAEGFFRKMWNQELLTVQEEVYVIFTDRNYKIIEWMLLHKGGVDKCHIDVSLLFFFAMKFKAKGLFVAHNHPEGSLTPSDEDDEMTEEIKLVADKLKIKFLDHIILTKDSHTSYCESGWL